MFYCDIAEILCGAKNEPADVGEWVGVAHDFIDDEFAHDKETGGAKRLGLPDDGFGHFFVDPSAKAAEQVLCGMFVVTVNDVVAFFKLIDEFETFAGGRLTVVIEADDIIAGGLAVACH